MSEQPQGKLTVESMFRAYDIRGIFNENLTPEVVSKIGIVYGNFLGCKGRVCVGKDVRTSSDIVENAFISGLASTGVDVELTGLVPIPTANFTIWQGKYDGGAYITASHNPPSYNGVRFRHPDGSGFTEENEEIKKLFLKGEVKRSAWDKPGKIRMLDTKEVVRNYCEYLVSKLKLEKKLKVVADPGNGAASVVISHLFSMLDTPAVLVNYNIDGRFPGRGPNPTLSTLGETSKIVKSIGADFGVGYDGDSDRGIFIDDKGRAISSEKIGVILARDVLTRHKGANIVANAPCSMIIEEEINKIGGKVIRTRVGDVYVTKEIKKHNAKLGIEISAHLFLPEFYIFDDPIAATLRLAEILSKSPKKLSELVDEIPEYPMLEKSLHSPDEIKFQVMDDLKERFKKEGYKMDLIDGVKVIFDDGWVMLRPSNTEPVIRLFVEAKNKERLNELAKKFEGEFNKSNENMKKKM